MTKIAETVHIILSISMMVKIDLVISPSKSDFFSFDLVEFLMILVSWPV